MPLEELCSDCPELAGELLDRIRVRLRGIDPVLDIGRRPVSRLHRSSPQITFWILRFPIACRPWRFTGRSDTTREADWEKCSPQDRRSWAGWSLSNGFGLIGSTTTPEGGLFARLRSPPGSSGHRADLRSRPR